MTASEFYKEFKGIFCSEKNLSRAMDTWKNRGDFTKFIMPKIAEVFNNHGMKTQYEYYNVDLIAWTDRKSLLPKQKNGYKLKKHLWTLDAAIEHENDQTDWTDELVKLLYLNCPLRVVIGYIPFELADLDSVLDYAAATVNLADPTSELIKSGQQFVLILGRNLADSATLSSEAYSAYLFDTDTRRFMALDK